MNNLKNDSINESLEWQLNNNKSFENETINFIEDQKNEYEKVLNELQCLIDYWDKQTESKSNSDRLFDSGHSQR